MYIRIKINTPPTLTLVYQSVILMMKHTYRPDGSGYHVVLDTDDVEASNGIINRDPIMVPKERIRTFTAPWQLSNITSLLLKA